MKIYSDIIPMIHKVGEGGCGKPAFLVRGHPKPGDPIILKDVFLLDGTHPKNAFLIICGTCGGKTFPLEVEPKGGWYGS